jgi:hypothetical protein
MFVLAGVRMVTEHLREVGRGLYWDIALRLQLVDLTPPPLDLQLPWLHLALTGKCVLRVSRPAKVCALRPGFYLIAGNGSAQLNSE